MARLIFTGLAPNMERDDVALDLRLLFAPWTWVKGKGRARLEDALSRMLGGASVFAFTSGRGSLAAILEAYGFEPGSEILLQAYTCVVVPNAIRWTGGVPVYADLAPHAFTMDPEDFERKITPKSRAVIVQHTFGHPAPLSRIRDIAKKHNLVVIEDGAHTLGADTGVHPAGALGDASFFSFGRDKAISSVFGGCAVTKDPRMAERLRHLQSRAGDARRRWIFQQLVYPFVLSIVKATYGIWIGRILFFIAKRLRIISLAIHPAERAGNRPLAMTRRLPNALAVLALHQLGKLDRLNAHRKAIVALYEHELSGVPGLERPSLADSPGPLIRYTIRTPNALRVITAAKRSGILLGDWYRTPIAPEGTAKIAGYVEGSCPVAEKIASDTVNLPTDIHVSKADALRIAKIVRETA